MKNETLLKSIFALGLIGQYIGFGVWTLGIITGAIPILITIAALLYGCWSTWSLLDSHRILVIKTYNEKNNLSRVRG